MRIKIQLLKNSSTFAKHNLVALPVTAAEKKRSGLKRFSDESASLLAPVDRALNGALFAAVERFDFLAAARSGLDVSVFSPRSALNAVRLFGLPTNPGADDWRRFAGDALQAARRQKAKSLLVSLETVHAAALEVALEALVEGLHLSSYRFTRYKKTDSPDRLPNVSIALALDPKKIDKRILRRAEVSAAAVSFARDIVNAGPSDHTPADFVHYAQSFARKNRRLKLKVFNQTQLQKLGANALLAVARGSTQKPYMLHLKVGSKKRGGKTLLFVGKGITFDSGGLSIKTGKGMEEMKCDMAGAAAVLGAMSALAAAPELCADHEVHALIPTCENMINGNSVKPGDVVRAMNGKTIEILNTDAEGRLILADALSYGARLKPDTIIDLATLTGACVVALGSDYAGLFTEDEKLKAALLAASTDAGENLWPLPLAAEYRGELNSPIADLKNIGSGGPGAITAALFLKEFVPAKTAWAHLDIAGPAFVGKTNEYTPAGGTGFGVRTLLRAISVL